MQDMLSFDKGICCTSMLVRWLFAVSPDSDQSAATAGHFNDNERREQVPVKDAKKVAALDRHLWFRRKEIKAAAE